MTSRQAFRALAQIYRMIGNMGFTPGKGHALSKSLDLIAELRLPGQAGAVLTGFLAQGRDGWCEEMSSHLQRLGVQPASLHEAAVVWQAVAAEAQKRGHQQQGYNSVAHTYARGLLKIQAAMERDPEALLDGPAASAKKSTAAPKKGSRIPRQPPMPPVRAR